MCGVFGAVLGESFGPAADEAARIAALGIFALQHRGQESAGMAVSDGENVMVMKDMGLVASVFDDRTLHSLLDQAGRIGLLDYRPHYGTFTSKIGAVRGADIKVAA